MEDGVISWNSDSPPADAAVEEVGHFSARGMSWVYGRGDHFGRHHSFNMDIWRGRDGLMMRCWSRCQGIDWQSFQIRLAGPTVLQQPDKGQAALDSWIPRAVRHAYEQWIRYEF